jgi:nicotinamidase-related amidase
MKPYEAAIDLDKTAVIIIDMQIDFLKVRRCYLSNYNCLFSHCMSNALTSFPHACLPSPPHTHLTKPGGFGESLGNDVSLLQSAVGPCQKVLQAAREHQVLVIHTREGHRPELSDLHRTKQQRPGAPESTHVIGRPGPRGKILVRGEEGHDIIPELYPREGEPIIDKPGKGSFYATDLECILKAQGITTLVVCGVTTEVCVHTTIREGES